MMEKKASIQSGTRVEWYIHTVRIRTAKWSSKSYPCVGAARCRILHTELLNKVSKDSHHCQKANQKIFFLRIQLNQLISSFQGAARPAASFCSKHNNLITATLAQNSYQDAKACKLISSA
ncbi:hypothetical protein pipiens_001715 [Culex pipiens pipiens]|uniref:Uncharacterized protein n=1 Tax=Culex pipiens pipiens TaxID=38569 RepID=A0ABD1DZH9_CULPP